MDKDKTIFQQISDVIVVVCGMLFIIWTIIAMTTGLINILHGESLMVVLERTFSTFLFVSSFIIPIGGIWYLFMKKINQHLK